MAAASTRHARPDRYAPLGRFPVPHGFLPDFLPDFLPVPGTVCGTRILTAWTPTLRPPARGSAFA